MKHIKYIIFLLSIVLLGNFTKADPIQLRIPDSTATVGDFINMPIYVDSSLTGENVFSYQFQISYTNSRLNFISIEITGTMVQSWGSPLVNSSTPGILSIAGAGTTPLIGTGVLFYMRFECIQNGTGYLNFDGGTANNFFNEHLPEVILDDGYISISPAPSIHVTPENGLLAVGEELQFNVSGGTSPYIWSSTNPTVAFVNSSGLLTASATGFTRVVAEDAMGIKDTIDESVEVRALKLTIPDTSAWQGSMVEIPVYISDVTGLNIISGNFCITFNQNILTAINYNKTGSLLEGYSNILFNNSHPGELLVAFAGTTPLSGSGVLLYLQFNVSSVYTGGTYLSFTNALFNEIYPAKTVNGYFTTINFPTINVSPYTYSIVAGETVQFNASGGIPPYTWNSSDNLVATIDASGLLTAHCSGVIQITATDDIGATGSSGDITVYDTYVTIPDVYGSILSIYDLPVIISDLPAGQSVFSISGTISFETPELDAVDIITDGTLTTGWAFFKVITGNKISFAFAGTTSFNSPGVMFKIRFQLTPDLMPGENAWVNLQEIILNEGIPSPLLVNGSITGADGIIIDLWANLEGPFNGMNMNTDLNSSGHLPHYQPYNTSPWNYPGTEYVGTIPNSNVVDWGLIELRETSGGAVDATPGTMIARQAAFFLSNGEIVGTDGIRNLVFSSTVTNNLFVIIWHRNHLGIMSAVPVTISGGIYTYDFTAPAGQAYGGVSAQVNLSGGEYGMFAGNGNGDNDINPTDKTGIWEPDAGNNGYLRGDFNMNGQVNNQDKNGKWLPNDGTAGHVPD